MMMRNRTRFFGSAAVLAALVGVGLATPGCQDPSRETPPAPAPEASFAEQAEAVRRGASDQIRVDQGRVTDEQLDALDGLQDKLRRINLSHTEVTDAGLSRIAGMRKLIQLRLASNRITDAGLECLEQLKELRHLHLIDAPIGDAGLEHLQTACRSATGRARAFRRRAFSRRSARRRSRGVSPAGPPSARLSRGKKPFPPTGLLPGRAYVILIAVFFCGPSPPGNWRITLP